MFIYINVFKCFKFLASPKVFFSLKALAPFSQPMVPSVTKEMMQGGYKSLVVNIQLKVPYLTLEELIPLYTYL